MIFLSLASDAQEKRIALIIGVANYTNPNVQPLKNSVHDAEDMATAMKARGFEVTTLLDPQGKEEIKKAILAHLNKTFQDPFAIGVFFYAGHGLEVEGKHYIVPAGADTSTPEKVKSECVQLDAVLNNYHKNGLVVNKLNCLFFDACFGGGSSVLSSPTNGVIVLANQPGSCPYDGDGRNGVFTSKFLELIDRPGLNLEQFLRKVASEISAASSGKQRPFILSQYEGDFSFNAENKKGKNIALLIGVSTYDEAKLSLDRPVKDAGKLGEVLESGYTFNKEDIKILTNATRNEIFDELSRLRESVTPADNVLIFYAGHGYWDEKIKQGYWWPRDAGFSKRYNWLSNSDIKEQIRGINSAHTLLISDACFSGGIFRSRDPKESMRSAGLDAQMLYKMPSRRAITSGSLSSVPDESVFFNYLVKRLEQNPEQFLSSQELFESIRKAVINNSAIVPQDGVIGDAGDEGGDFIFVRKKK